MTPLLICVAVFLFAAAERRRRYLARMAAVPRRPDTRPSHVRVVR